MTLYLLCFSVASVAVFKLDGSFSTGSAVTIPRFPDSHYFRSSYFMGKYLVKCCFVIV